MPQVRSLHQISDVGSRPHSSACRTIITAELAKTPLGQARIAAASARIDKAVEELGSNTGLMCPRGEKLEMVQHQPTVQVVPQFLPIPQSSSLSNEAQPSVQFDESR